jgi:multiple sugar transport system substrate-binding protein
VMRGMTRREMLWSTVLFAGGLAGCNLAGKGGGSGGKATFKVNWAVNNSSPAEVDLVQQVVDRFKAGHGNYDVSVLGYDPKTYDQKLLIDIAANTLPDIFVSADVYTKPFFDSGLTADLRPFMEKTGLDLANFDPKFIELAKYDGKVGFLPRAADVVVLYYNKRMFDEAGVKYPTEDWSHGDMLAAAEKLTKKAADGTITQYGVTANYTWWAYWVPLVESEGGKILSDDKKKVVFDSPEGIRAWSIIAQGLKNGWFIPTKVQDSMGGWMMPFANGQAAMVYTIRGGTPTFRAQLKDDWDVQLVPRGTASRKTGMGTMGYAMSAKTKNPDATWELLKYTFTEGMKVFMESYLLVPPIKTFYDDPAWKKLAGPPYSNDVFVKAMDSAMLPPPLPFYSTGPFRKAMEDGLDAVLLGQMTIEQAVRRMAEEGTKTLAG